MELDSETMKFLAEREEKLGAKIIMRTYALYYLSSKGEKREYGVFLYSDGSTFIFEDFDRPPTFLGIPIKTKNKGEYVKMEHSFKKDDVLSVAIVSRSSAEKYVKGGSPCSSASLFTRLFRKTLLEVSLKEGLSYYFELIDPKEVIKLIEK